MANISADLVRYNGLIGPQYLDPDDKTGGPDGTMKPITKDILKEMIVTNFPELMNVTDLEVQNKLEQVETKLAALDQKLMTLDDIKQQLQGTINTQVTGSLMEKAIVLNATVDAGKIGVHPVVLNSSFKAIVRIHNGISNPWRLSEVPSTLSWPGSAVKDILSSDGTSAPNAVSGGSGSRTAAWSEVTTPLFNDTRLFFYNEGTTPIEYSIIIVEVLGATENPANYVAKFNETQPLIYPTNTRALFENKNRKYALIVNDSDIPIYISLGGTAEKGKGIRINPNGGSYEISKANGNMFLGHIYAATGDIEKNLLVVEGV